MSEVRGLHTVSADDRHDYYSSVEKRLVDSTRKAHRIFPFAEYVKRVWNHKIKLKSFEAPHVPTSSTHRCRTLTSKGRDFLVQFEQGRKIHCAILFDSHA